MKRVEKENDGQRTWNNPWVIGLSMEASLIPLLYNNTKTFETISTKTSCYNKPKTLQK